MAPLDPTAAPTSATSTLTDRRAYVRLASDRPVRCTTADRSADRCRDPGWPGRLRDISQGGFGLMMQHRFRQGTVLLVDLREQEGEVIRSMRARVVHATALLVDGNPCWLLGCTFEELLSEAEVTALR